ncbi:hypothetical protein [Phenylobacterium sp.]|uniref:hypothetical protein n=1 Tax=Phenylobacterium sp. TaxID=1871053 RepID=UPI003D2E54A4
MNRRQLLLASLAVAAPPPALAAVRTRWNVTGSEGFDAIGFLGPLSGKVLYARFYAKELAEFRPVFPAPAQAALDRLQSNSEARGNLLWPALSTIVSGAKIDTLDELIDAIDQADARLKAPYKGSEHWDQESWDTFMAERSDLRVVLGGLRDGGFVAFRQKLLAGRLEPRIATLTTYLARYDVVAEQERLLGRPLMSRTIDIVLMWFSKPHGVRVQGQRFLSHVDYPDGNVVSIAAHEVLHPPIPMDGRVAKAVLNVLGRDELFARIVAEHDKSFGYNSLEGLLNEDICQALDQIVSERLGVAQPASKRWFLADGGMHVLAAGLYETLKAEGYDKTGGNLERWLGEAAKTGKLSPARLHPAAAKVLGKPVDRLWVRPAA